MIKSIFTTLLLFISLASFSQLNKILFESPQTLNETDVLIKWTKLDDLKNQNYYLIVNNIKLNKEILRTEISKLDLFIVKNLEESVEYEYWIQFDEHQKTNKFPIKLVNKKGLGNLSNVIQYVFIKSFNGNILSDLTLCNGGNSTLYASTTPANITNLTYQWVKDGVDILGETNPTLKTTGIGNYSLKVFLDGSQYNSYYNINLKYSNTIYAGVSGVEPIVQCFGRTRTLNVTYDSDNAIYQWVKNGINIDGATNKTYIASETGGYKVKVQENGCTIYNSLESNRVILENALFPNIFKADSLYCENGNSINLQNGNVSPSYYNFQWLKNGQPIKNATSYYYNANDEGIYSVKLSQDNCISVSEGVKISKIVEYPKSLIVFNHTDVCLANTIIISNTNQSRTYQWIKNGVNLVGENLQHLVISQSGTYKCLISSNGLCPTLSEEIIVGSGTNLNPKIEYSTTDEDCGGLYLLYKGITYSGQVDLSNLTFQWVLNGNNISNATGFSYYATQNGNYQLRVTNTLTGCTGISNVLVPKISNTPKLVVDTRYAGSACKNTVAKLWLNKWRNSQTLYRWKKNGVLLPNEIYDDIYITESGNYSVVFSTGSCITESDPISIRIDSIPSASLNGNSNILLNQVVDLPFVLSGGSDYFLKLNDDTSYFLKSINAIIQKQPLVNTSYSISAFGNHCGIGAFSGSHIVNILSCPSINTINNMLSTTITLKASEKINGQNLIQTGANVRYSAKKSIIMSPPFKTEIGSTFQADTEGCDN